MSKITWPEISFCKHKGDNEYVEQLRFVRSSICDVMKTIVCQKKNYNEVAVGLIKFLQLVSLSFISVTIIEIVSVLLIFVIELKN